LIVGSTKFPYHRPSGRFVNPLIERDMTDSKINSLLNDVLIELHRSLVQYTAEAWPWSTSQDAESRQLVQQIALRQQAEVAELAQLLQARGWVIDFGVYPQDYTTLHYVALEFLLSYLKTNQGELADWLFSLLPEFTGDSDAETLVRKIATSERNAHHDLCGLKFPSGASEMAWMK